MRITIATGERFTARRRREWSLFLRYASFVEVDKKRIKVSARPLSLARVAFFSLPRAAFVCALLVVYCRVAT